MSTKLVCPTTALSSLTTSACSAPGRRSASRPRADLHVVTCNPDTRCSWRNGDGDHVHLPPR